MKTIGLNLAGALVLLMLVSSCRTSGGIVDEPIETVSMSAVLKRIEPSLLKLDAMAKAKNLNLENVTLTLNTASTGKKGGELSVLVFKAGASTSSAITSEYTVTLTKLKASRPTAEGVDTFFDNLTSIVEQSSNIAGLGTSEVTGTLKFVVEKSKDGGIDEWELSPVTVSISGSVTNSYTQTLVIKLTRPETGNDAV
ncbi:MAG: hypothetical protein WD002_02745 [Pseudomonadales bacterium]